MNRNQEYTALLKELEHPPEKLQSTAQRAVSRERALRRRARAAGAGAACMAVCVIGFVLMVNLSIPFARACGNIPLVRDLAKAVAWSPSLAAAVENEYVQPIGKRQTVNGITAAIEYVIVDQKQLYIFFTLQGDYENLSADMPEFTPVQRSCSISSADFLQPPGTLLYYTLDYKDADVPDFLTITFGVTTYVQGDHAAAPGSYRDDMLTPREPEEPEYLAKFTFDLAFDPQFTQQGETLSVNQTVLLEGQSVTVAEAEVYPTHMRLIVKEDPENTARLTNLAFYLENENGERFFPVSQGIVSSGTLDEPMITAYRLESPFFSQSRHLTLHITTARWQTDTARRVRVDLAEGTAEFLPTDVEFLWAERREAGWLVAFASPQEADGGLSTRFASRFWDEAGEEYEIMSHSMTIGVEDQTGERTREDTMFTEVLPLAGLEGDIAYLEARYNLETAFDPDISVTIK